MGTAEWIAFCTLLIVGFVAGYFMHRSDFCLAGAFRDAFLFRSVRRLGPLLLLVSVTAVLFEACRLLGWLTYHPFPWFSAPSPLNLVGGLIFGLGMVLAGGCVVGVLYKMGSGSVLAMVAFIGLLFGSGLYVELHPYWSRMGQMVPFRVDSVTLPEWSGVSPTWWVAGMVVVGGLFALRWLRTDRQRRPHAAMGYIPLWKTAIILSALSLVTVLVAGVPMGVTTSYAKLAGMIEQLVAPEHVASQVFFTAQPAQLLLPHGSTVLTGGGGPQWDVVALVQYPLILGIVSGSMVSALLLKELAWHWAVPKRQVLMVFLGGTIMALGSRMTPGCNVWHLMGGLPLLTMQSLLFLAGMVPGAWLGTLCLKRIVV